MRQLRYGILTVRQVLRAIVEMTGGRVWRALGPRAASPARSARAGRCARCGPRTRRGARPRRCAGSRCARGGERERCAAQRQPRRRRRGDPLHARRGPPLRRARVRHRARADRLPGRLPARAGRLGRFYDAARHASLAATAARVERLLAAARRAGLTVAHSRSHRYGAAVRRDLLEGQQPGAPDVADDASGVAQHFGAVDRGYELLPSLRARPGEIVVDKWTFGAFASTDLEAQLRARGVRKILLAGILTNVCVFATAVQACDRFFRVCLVEDASGRLLRGLAREGGRPDLRPAVRAGPTRPRPSVCISGRCRRCRRWPRSRRVDVLSAHCTWGRGSRSSAACNAGPRFVDSDTTYLGLPGCV